MKISWARLAPALAGARIFDRIVAGLGAMAGVGLAGLLSDQAAGGTQASPWLVAPIGASAVLLFAVPASPLAQPWSIIGGNVVSGLIGLTVGARIGDPLVGCGVAVGLAIMAMSLLKCLHPPGGAVALMTALMAHHGVTSLTYAFAPIGLNSAFLVALGVCFHRFSSHSYPHGPPAPPENIHETSDAPPIQRGGFVAEDMDAALAQLHESYDIDREDLELLLRLAEARALSRRHRNVTCADIMSREVLCVDQYASLEEARETFELRALRRAPVIDSNRVVVGVLTPSGLLMQEGPVSAAMLPALLVTPETPVLDLAPKLADGRAHEAVVIDAGQRVIGLVTQSDLLALTLRLLSAAG